MSLSVLQDQEVRDDAKPDHDFHSGWGVSYTNRSMSKDEYAFKLWQDYAVDPVRVERQYHRLLHEYTATFSSFFQGYYPFSLHAHASDALSPTTIVSLILNTAATSPLVLNSPALAPAPGEDPDVTGGRVRAFALSQLGWTETHVQNPKFITTNDIYGAGFGPMAHASHEWEVQAVASGPMPVIVQVTETEEALDEKFARAKNHGCIAMVFDMVSTNDGSVLSPENFAKLQVMCIKHKLLMIVDETMTAIRCGAPFAFQRPEYSQATPLGRPDLVIFGKGMGVSGVAMSFDGITTKDFAFSTQEEIRQSLIYWRALVSRPARLPNLIESLGLVRTAQRENWPARSLQVGASVRRILAADLPPELQRRSEIRGLGAVIAVHRDVSLHYNIMAAIRRRSPWSRWLPKLDPPYSDEALLRENVFGKESKVHRANLSKEAQAIGNMPLWCLICGIEASSDQWCRTCFVACCNNEVCEEAISRHICVT